MTPGTETMEDYTGHELDAETGMHYAGARYYMSGLGRWTSVDPILGEQRPSTLLEQDVRLLSMSPYNYVYGNPVGLTDPDGRCPNCISGAVGAGAGAVIQGGSELLSQLSSNGWSLSAVGWKKVGGEALYGAGKGALIGATGGLGTAALAGAVGGTAETVIRGQVEGEEVSVGSVVEGAVQGGFEGTLGSGIVFKAAGGVSPREFKQILRKLSGTEAGKALTGRFAKEGTASSAAALSSKTAEGFGTAVQLIIDGERERRAEEVDRPVDEDKP